jgi:hypothetical protein
MQQQKKVTNSELPTTMESSNALALDEADAVSDGKVALVDTRMVLAEAAEQPIAEKTFDGGFYSVTSPVRSVHSTPNNSHANGLDHALQIL